jgi:2,4-dienoyl-CoA reductase (NADPH2)
VFCACRLDPVIGEEYLQRGKLDFVGMTRRLLADPELPKKVIENRMEDIRPCTGCLHCIDVRNKNQLLECQVNASLGRERDFAIKPAEQKKRVVVVGGGPAGMEAACIAAARGHEVSLYEKLPRLGGLVPTAAMVKDLEGGDLLKLINYFKTRMKKEGVAYKSGKEVRAKDIEDFQPEVLVVAGGAAPSTLEIPGSRRSNVVHSSKLHKQLRFFMRFFGVKTLQSLTKIWMPIGKRVVVVGGSIMGCETAEFLIKRGRQVTIVHDGTTIGDGIPVEDQMRLLPWLDKKGIVRYTEAKFEEVTEKGLTITTKEGEKKTLEADTILVTLPYLKNDEIYQKFDGKASKTHTIGSSAEPGLIVNAILDGSKTGREI